MYCDIIFSFFVLGYNERTWEPSQNLDNCPEMLKEYMLAVKLKRQEQKKAKKAQHDEEQSTNTTRFNQRVVSKKNAKAINYKKVIIRFYI